MSGSVPSQNPYPAPLCPRHAPTSSSEVEYVHDSIESYEYEQSAKVISVKSRLRENVQFWQSELHASNFILNTIKYGYVIPFVAVPPGIILKNNRSSINHKEFVCSAISELVSAGCVKG
jgi:hypothetical protein